MPQASDSGEPVREHEPRPPVSDETQCEANLVTGTPKMGTTEPESRFQSPMPKEADSTSDSIRATQEANTMEVDCKSKSSTLNEAGPTSNSAQGTQETYTMAGKEENSTVGTGHTSQSPGEDNTENGNGKDTPMSGTQDMDDNTKPSATLESGLNPGSDFDCELARVQQDQMGLNGMPFESTVLDMTEDVASTFAMNTGSQVTNKVVLPEPNDPSDQLFCSEGEGTGPSNDVQKAQSTRGGKSGGKGGKASSGKSNLTGKKKGQTVTKSERKKNANAFESFKIGRKRQSRAKEEQNKGSTAAAIQKGNGKRKPRAKRRENANIGSIYTLNTLAQAKENAKVEEKLSFTAKAKKKAVGQMIDQVEGLDRGTILTDERAIMEAIQRFRKGPRADGEGGWRHTLMETSLFHYQLLGVGFMREREASNAAPYGGFLCDEMGFGKTIQAIANIVDDDTGSGDLNKTLIVAPAHLVPHWENEISKHVKKGIIPLTMQHTAAYRAQDNVLQYLLGNGDKGVIITTYGDIRRSCPDPNKVDGIKEWADKIDKQGGILHRHKFRRIILDEAHEIKNHLSKTSLAVRNLSGTFRWVITGTPIHNSDEEFYSYFDFLKIPGTGLFQRFRKTYCSDDTTERTALHGVLRAYMLRRTHQEKLFGLPVLKLPDVDEQSISINFSKAERHLYRAMTVLCVKELFQMFRTNEEDNRVYRCYLTYLLHLRMFTSHLLLCPVLESLATPELLQDVRAAAADDGNPEDLETCYLLEKLMKGQELPYLDELAANHPTGNRSAREPYTPGKRALISRFRSKLNLGRAVGNETETWETVKCKGCSASPFDAYVMSCMHVVCHSCLASQNKRGNRIECVCGAEVTEYAFYHAIESLCGTIPPCTSSESTNQVEGVVVPSESEHRSRWVHAAGHLMQGAKLKATRSCIRDWFEESPNVKVVLFIQFLDMVDILSAMCCNEEWGFGTLTGKTSPAARADDIRRFREDPEMRVMIASLKAGGVGLDLTMATRCILIDPWWNDAVELQAFCRLYRIGQKKSVKFVRLCVRDSIDDRIGEIQQFKSDKIERAMGPEVIPARETINNVLAVSGLVLDENTEEGFRFIDDKTSEEN